jgi:hypothetical protein
VNGAGDERRVGFCGESTARREVYVDARRRTGGADDVEAWKRREAARRVIERMTSRVSSPQRPSFPLPGSPRLQRQLERETPALGWVVSTLVARRRLPRGRQPSALRARRTRKMRLARATCMSSQPRAPRAASSGTSAFLGVHVEPKSSPSHFAYRRRSLDVNVPAYTRISGPFPDTVHRASAGTCMRTYASHRNSLHLAHLPAWHSPRLSVCRLGPGTRDGL